MGRGGGSSQDPEIAVSRTERTPVSGTISYADWYLDELGFIDHDTDLTDGLKYFYSQTGIQPYVVLLQYEPSVWTDGKWDETETIFWSYFDMNYNNLDLSIAEFMGRTFRQTADNIMHISTNEDNNNTFVTICAAFAVVCVIVIITGIIVFYKMNRKGEF